MAVTILSGCSDDGLDAVLAYDIGENPKTIDPQQANDPNSVQIVQNVFMGLMRYGADGSVQLGAAESYTVSEDELTYNFKLREDVFWTNCAKLERQCTAKDFVFGFRRLFDTSTNSPRAKEYLCIKNAEEMYIGKYISEDNFGVKAINDFELEITLDYADPRFLQLLCEAPAMPCNEEFFNDARGKYGLSAECTPSNGAFYVREWYFDPYASTDVNHVFLYRNSKNAEVFEVCPAAVKLFIEDKEDFIGDFLSGDTSCIAVSNEERSKISGNYIYKEFSSITVGLTFNEKYELAENLDFRKALELSIPREKLSQAMKDFKGAEGVIPRGTKLYGENYREQAGVCDIPGYDPDEAEALFKTIRSTVDSKLLRGARVITKSDDAHTAAQYITQEWQSLGFYCQLEELSESEFNSRIAEGTYEMAITELSGGYDSPEAYLGQLNAGENKEALDLLLSSAYLSKDGGADIYRKAEQLIIDNCAFIPIYYKNEFFITEKDVSDVIYDPFTKTIDFTRGKIK